MITLVPEIAEAIRRRWGSQARLRQAADDGDRDALLWMSDPALASLIEDAEIEPDTPRTAVNPPRLPRGTIAEMIAQSPDAERARAASARDRAERRERARAKLAEIVEGTPAAESY